MGGDGSVINWSIYASLPIPLYDPAPSPSLSHQLTANTMPASKSGASDHTPTKTFPS